MPGLVKDVKASLLVTDFSPLRLGVEWRRDVAAAVSCPVQEVDAHNVVPVWVTSDKVRGDDRPAFACPRDSPAKPTAPPAASVFAEGACRKDHSPQDPRQAAAVPQGFP